MRTLPKQFENTVKDLSPGVLLLLVVLFLLPFAMTAFPFYIHIFIMLCFYAALASAWNIIGGYAGQLSLGHSAFYGIGAYTSAILAMRYGLSPWIGMLAGGALAAVAAAGIGYPCFRLRGPFFTLSTLAFGEVLRIIANYWKSLTEGPDGITVALNFGFWNFVFKSKISYAYISLVLALLIVLVSRSIYKSKFGHYLVALREDEEAAEASGINVSKYKLRAMVVSGFLTGICGVFSAQYALYIEPDNEFSLGFSVLIALIAIFGGAGSVSGPILGAIVLIPIQEVLRAWLGGAYHGLHSFIFGTLLVIIVIFLPRGIVEWARKSLEIFPRFLGKPQSEIRALPVSTQNRFLDWSWVTPTANPTESILLKTNGLAKRFGGLVAVKNVNFEIKKGEILGLIGPNGAGKSTIFNLISAVYQADQGHIFFKNENIMGIKKPHQIALRGIGRTFQLVKPFTNITVLENIMTGAFARVETSEEARADALQVSEFLGLTDKKDSLARSLTISDRKRLELARALATRPELLLLDEVMSGLTPKEIENFVNILREIRKKGVTILVIEHVMSAIMTLSDRIMILHHGEKIAEGPPKEIASNEVVIKAYLGEEYVIPS
jgi:branched-chain amino acid transport system permease protein